MIQETRRQRTRRLIERMAGISDKSKVYSYNKLKEEDVIAEASEKDTYKIRFCEKCNKMTCHYGVCLVCKAKATGLGNPEIHKKTIKTQLEKGTHNFYQPQTNPDCLENIKYRFVEKYCEECDKTTKQKFYPKSGTYSCCTCSAKDNGYNIRYCEECNENTKHNGRVCIVCFPEADYCAIGGQRVSYLKSLFIEGKVDDPEYQLGKEIYEKFSDGSINFTVKDGQKLYKKIPVEQISESILDGTLDINDFPGFSIKFGEVYVNTENIVTGEIFKLNASNFIEKDNKIYVRHSNEIKLWNSVKKQVESNNKDLDFLKDSEYDYRIIKTFRENKNTTKGQYIMEQYLVDEGITYLVFVKFFINTKTKDIKPLVVGETASKLVNFAGTDIGFSLRNADSCPGRRFIKENSHIDWYRNEIVIIPCSTKQEAAYLEKLICLEYSLFYS